MADTQQTPQIGVAVGSEQEYAVLTGLAEAYDIVEFRGAVPADVDLCIADEEMVQTQPARFTEWREQQSPVFAPIVLLTQSDSTAMEDGDETPSVRCDSVVSLPVSAAAFHTRLDNLLERRRLSRELADEKQLTASLFDSSPLAKLVLGPDGTIERANPRAGELFDVAHSELVGQPYNTDGWIMLDEDEKRVVEEGFPFTAVFEADTPVAERECTIRQPDGRDTVVAVTAVPIRRAGETVEHVLLTLDDITARRERTAARERQFDITVAGTDVGGTAVRSVFLDGSTGVLTIETTGGDRETI